MKALKLIVLMVALGALFTFSSCGGDGTTPEPVTDQQLTKLSKAWKLTAVTRNGSATDESALLYKTTGTSQFKLTVTGTKGTTTFAYTTSNNPALSVWKGSSDWSFGTDPLTMVKRDLTAPVNMNYVVTATTLTLSFNFTGTGYASQGRAEQVTGDWVFTFGL